MEVHLISTFVSTREHLAFQSNFFAVVASTGYWRNSIFNKLLTEFPVPHVLEHCTHVDQSAQDGQGPRLQTLKFSVDPWHPEDPTTPPGHVLVRLCLPDPHVSIVPSELLHTSHGDHGDQV